MKKIVITGAAGEVGFNLISLLAKSPYKVVAIDKNSNNLKLLKRLFPFIKAVHADLAEIGRWKNEFKNAYCVIQLHAQISSAFDKPYIRNNITAIQNVIDVCEEFKIQRLVHASSSVVVGICDDRYSRTKKKGERIVRNSNVPYTILRPTLMYGCFDIKHLGYMVAMFENYPVFLMPGSGRYIRQPLYVEDFCKIIIECIERKQERKIYDISGKEKIHLIDCLKIIFEEKRKKITFIKVPLSIFYVLIRTYGIIDRKTRIVPEQLTSLTAGDIFSVIKWDQIFNVKPTSYKDGVRKMLKSKYYKYYKEMKTA